MSKVDQAKAWLASLSERERRMVIWGGVAAALFVFVFVLVLPLYTGASRAAVRVAQKKDDLAWMRSVADELRAAGPATEATGESLLVLIDQSARQSGLGSSLSGSQPSGTGGIRVRLDGAPFDTVVAWIALLQQQHSVMVESATIDRGSVPGAVNASLIFRKVG
jgi:general secretion pathway protein M